MQQRQEQLATSVALPQNAVRLYQAATLTERIASWPAKSAAYTPNEESRREEAEKTLQHWKAQKPFDNGSLFADRLAMDTITEQDLLASLAEPLEVLQERLSHPAPPDWVTELVDALHSGPTPLSVSEEALGHLSQKFAFLQPFYPLMQKSIARLQAGIEALTRAGHVLPCDPQTMLSLLLPTLLQHIEPQVSKTLVLELHIARLRGQLQGETPQARFQDYLRLLCQPEQLRFFLEEYCVLARHITVSCQLWADCSLEFVQRLCTDWQEILTLFSPAQEPGSLIEVKGGAGDTHRGGHSVMILTFGSGWRLLYKPKPLTIDRHFQELLAWLNARGSHPAFRLLKLIDKTTYGWTEYCMASSCSSEEEVARFYERQGGYLALLYGLEATDFHYENVLAAGEHPLLIDLEALFHPDDCRKDATLGLGHQSLEHSVLRSLLLPSRVLFNEEGEGVDIGGLSRQIEGQLSPRPVSQWAEVGTDEMRVVRKRVELAGSDNCPRLHGQQIDPLEYIESLVKGFSYIYRLLMTERDGLLTTVLPRFAQDEIRFVARATRTYAVLLLESFHPNLLRDALTRERLFDRLWLAVEHQPALARLIPAERADLLRGDIPLFTTRPESRNLWTSRGECLPMFFAASSLELVSERLQQLNESDLRQQIWLIRASFAHMAGQRLSAVPAAGGNQSMLSACSPVGRERLLAEARAIGNRLCASALGDEKCADWVGLVWVMERDWQIASAGLDLYGGLPGILLFLSYLGWITEETRYTDLARAGLNTLRAVMQQNQAFLDQIEIGAFSGLSSYLYLFTHLAVLWHDPTLLKEAGELAQLIPGKIEKDEHFDLVDGAAGCLASLLSLYVLTPAEQILQAAVQCGEHLLAHTQPMAEGLGWKARQQDAPLSGFARGAAGIAWSLLRLAEVSGEQRFQDTAVAALAYERSLFSPEQRNWLDLRKRPGNASVQGEQEEASAQAQPVRCGMSWSHGAPGIALGRMASLPYLDDAAIRAEIEIALETTMAQGFGYVHEQVGPNHSLIHGDCGNLETVLLAAQTLHVPQWHAHLQRLTAQLLASRQQHGWIMGVPLNVETPGLLLGLAGIGYELLRLAEPERVPSLLTLAPPTASMGV